MIPLSLSGFNIPILLISYSIILIAKLVFSRSVRPEACCWVFNSLKRHFFTIIESATLVHLKCVFTRLQRELVIHGLLQGGDHCCLGFDNDPRRLNRDRSIFSFLTILLWGGKGRLMLVAFVFLRCIKEIESTSFTVSRFARVQLRRGCCRHLLQALAIVLFLVQVGHKDFSYSDAWIFCDPAAARATSCYVCNIF